ncbi:MAG: hypothetical protein ACREJ6_03310 [Candidatus Methylomirabilis sp.]
MKAASKKSPTTKNQTRLALAFMPPPNGPVCFAAMLAGEAKEFVAAVVEQAKAGGYVNKTMVLEMLQKDFLLDISSTSTVKRHMEGRCACERRNARINQRK